MGTLVPLTQDGVDELLSLPVAVVFKHSPTCGISRRAMAEMERFVDERPDTPVYIVDVIQQRPLARRLAELLNVAHASPQVLVLEAGTVTWHTSHSNVQAERLEARLDRRSVPGPA